MTRLRGLLVTLTLGLVAASATAQDPVKLRLQEKTAAGDVAASDRLMEVNADLVVRAGEQELVVPIVSRERKTYTETVLAADARGASSLRRVYTVARSQSSYGGEPPKVTTSSLQGKTVTLKRFGDRLVLSVLKGKLAPEDEKGLRRDLDPKRPELDFFPDREISPGDEWSPDPAVLRRMMDGAQKAEAKLKFVEITEFAGHRCGRFHATIDAEGTYDAGDRKMPITMNLSGDSYFALDLERWVSTELSGPVSMHGETTQNGMMITFEGVGTMRMKETNRWIKVAGKPVAR
jgi:hypothetical protein